MQQYILGIDIGTGSTKGVALALDGTVINAVQHYYGTYSPEQGFSEQDPELIWEAFIRCITDTVTKLSSTPLAISLSSAMHSVIPTDEQGNAITSMMTWADVRSESIASELRNSVDGERFYRITGTPIHPMSPLCKLIWLRENRADIFSEAKKFISIKGYIWHKLFGSFQIDYSIASASGLFDIQNLCWSPDACACAGVTADQLSEAVNTNYNRCDMDAGIAGLLQLPANTPFIIGASDGCCANLGSYVTEPGTAALTIGTSGAVRITGPEPVYNYNAMTFNYLLDEKTFVSGGAVNNGGNAVNWLLVKFMGITAPIASDYETLFNLIETVPAGSDGLLFMPYLFGERAPIWDAKSSGAFLNIRPEHSRNHFLRAALEGICFSLNDVLKSLEESSVNIKQINVSGGFTTSVTWMQLLADISGKPLFILQKGDASALGAVYLAMKELYPNHYPVKSVNQHNAVIMPNACHYATYSKMFLLYKTIYSNLKQSMALLYNLN